MSEKRTPGLVYLVGAGPGDPGLITVKGLACLRRADVVVADYLADARLVQEAPPHAERIFLSWEAGRQENINALLVERAQTGKTVVRLKGGDPFVFGRGGEEALYLREHGIPFEVVPGVTAAVAVPAYAGIPVTHRGITSTFTAVTGHEDPTKLASSINWTVLAPDAGTLIFFMGAKNLPFIVQKLIEHGHSPATPIALIQWGTTASQRTLIGTLETIVSASQAATMTRPVLIVIGQVVRLREQLNWFEARPLFGVRVLVTRSREQASDLSSRLAALGADPVEVPLIRFEDPADWTPIDEAIADLDVYDWLIFTSANAVDRWFQRLLAAGKDSRALRHLRIAAVGSATTQALERVGLIADFQPETFHAEALVSGLGLANEMIGARILFPAADLAGTTIKEGLAALGACVDQRVAYRTIQESSLPAEILALLEQGQIHMVTFTSASTARAFVKAVGPERLPGLSGNVVIACIGPITRDTAVEAGLRVDLLSKEATISSLVDAILGYHHQGRITVGESD